MAKISKASTKTKVLTSKPQRQENDPIYKELITACLGDLIQTMIPTLALNLDFSKAVARQQELYVYDKKAIHGHKKFADLLFEVPTKDQLKKEQIFIHIELENNDDLKTMQTRMRHYFYLIDLKYGISNLIPIVLFFNQKGNPGIHTERVNIGSQWFEVSTFSFLQWGLGNDSAENWLTANAKPLHAALAMHMQNKQLSAKEVFIQALEIIGKSTLEEVQEELLIDYIDSFSKLEVKTKEQILQQENQGANQMIKRWSQRIAEQSKLEGELKGKLEGKLEALVTVA